MKEDNSGVLGSFGGVASQTITAAATVVAGGGYADGSESNQQQTRDGPLVAPIVLSALSVALSLVLILAVLREPPFFGKEQKHKTRLSPLSLSFSGQNNFSFDPSIFYLYLVVLAVHDLCSNVHNIAAARGAWSPREEQPLPPGLRWEVPLATFSSAARMGVAVCFMGDMREILWNAKNGGWFKKRKKKKQQQPPQPREEDEQPDAPGKPTTRTKLKRATRRATIAYGFALVPFLAVAFSPVDDASGRTAALVFYPVPYVVALWYNYRLVKLLRDESVIIVGIRKTLIYRLYGIIAACPLLWGTVEFLGVLRYQFLVTGTAAAAANNTAADQRWLQTYRVVRHLYLIARPLQALVFAGATVFIMPDIRWKVRDLLCDALCFCRRRVGCCWSVRARIHDSFNSSSYDDNDDNDNDYEDMMVADEFSNRNSDTRASWSWRIIGSRSDQRQRPSIESNTSLKKNHDRPHDIIEINLTENNDSDVSSDWDDAMGSVRYGGDAVRMVDD
eukprot:CAMPEP_0201145382 /NCGR_PEP_ID=MMETSP0851-20130426/7102_1 /ASSEMBLY_ACC=CAM_ASM_000631 /TAXON_ID=183588 /ORGANISM="Pseudo-nitzschia fraudulenta, Strain WWA7" /LENGTH=503 /DNA_ID=CAMNT_0047420509 /DNA_START=97 /DNA_END=1608 /DNA_ORIENTATION=+